MDGATALNFTGTININSGVFGTDGGGGVQGSATVNVASGGVMALHNATAGWTIGGLNGSGDVSPAQGTAGPTYTLTVGAGNASGSFSGILHGNNSTAATDGSIEAGFLALVKTGSGTQYLSGANTYSGNTNVAGGILSVGSIADTVSSNLGIGSVTLSGGTLQYTRFGGRCHQPHVQCRKHFRRRHRSRRRTVNHYQWFLRQRNLGAP